MWMIVSGGAYPSVGDDPLIAQCMRLLSTTIKSGQYKSIYETQGALDELIRGIVVPNVQLRGERAESLLGFGYSLGLDHDVEQFEDDPLEFIRTDLSLPLATTGTASFSSTGGGDGTSRRQAAADVVRNLVVSGYEEQTTSIVLNWVQLGLQVDSFNALHFGCLIACRNTPRTRQRTGSRRVQQSSW